MLDLNDKKWVEDLLDRKLDGTKSDLRGEMQEMKTELRDEMQEMKTELRGEMQEMKTELRDEMQEMKTELRGEMQEMKTELRGEMQEMKTELRGEMQEMKGDIITQVTAVFENTYEDYIKLISEIVPDKVRSYDRVEEEQYRQQGEINLFKGIAADHEKRIAKLEAAVVQEGSPKFLGVCNFQKVILGDESISSFLQALLGSGFGG